MVSNRLPEQGIDFLMIGGHAVNYYGYVRATQDIDFMIAASDEEAVRKVMLTAGFTNVSSQENVVFFSQPNSPVRIDFLKVDEETMNELIGNAQTIEYFGQANIRVPQLVDLLAMKIFSLSNGGRECIEKDLPDVAHLAVVHDLDIDEVLTPLCKQFGAPGVLDELRAHMGRLQDA